MINPRRALVFQKGDRLYWPKYLMDWGTIKSRLGRANDSRLRLNLENSFPIQGASRSSSPQWIPLILTKTGCQTELMEVVILDWLPPLWLRDRRWDSFRETLIGFQLPFTGRPMKRKTSGKPTQEVVSMLGPTRCQSSLRAVWFKLEPKWQLPTDRARFNTDRVAG